MSIDSARERTRPSDFMNATLHGIRDVEKDNSQPRQGTEMSPTSFAP
jgi:hypothetical protein